MHALISAGASKQAGACVGMTETHSSTRICKHGHGAEAGKLATYNNKDTASPGTRVSAKVFTHTMCEDARKAKPTCK